MSEVFYPGKLDCMPDKKIFLARAGARYGKLDEDFIHRVNELFLIALEKIEPVVYYRTSDLSILPKEIIPSSFGNIKKMTIFLSTLGSAVDTLISQLSEQGKTFDAFIIDSWASEALETLNENFDQSLRERFGMGTMRFSPGYGNVDLRINKYIVKEFLGVDQVTVLDSGVMVPRKTTTCMVGWFNEEK
ncbi:methionine synthase [Thermotoga profunda]|uniref:methionine synthase n=1 Tax=Thermotoga profunda TaxID=1508420 RepID=UPI000A67C211|nr:methionine synthase [Thermotoga profunda]